MDGFLAQFQEMERDLHAHRLSTRGGGMSPYWAALTRTCTARLLDDPAQFLPSRPLEPSSVRHGRGLKIWDLMAALQSDAVVGKVSPAEGLARATHSRKTVPSNAEWLDPHAVNERGRYVFAMKDDVDIPYSLDLSREDARDPFMLYEMAHMLMHRWADPMVAGMGVKFRPWVYAKFLELATAHLLVAREFGFPIYVGQGSYDRNWLPPPARGLMVATARNMPDPVFGLPRHEILHPDRVDRAAAYVFVSVHVQPPPELFSSDAAMVDLVWAMGPMRAMVVGWEFVDFVYTGPMARTSAGKLLVGVRASDLLSPCLLCGYRQAVDGEPLAPPGEWASFDDLVGPAGIGRDLLAATPPLPFEPALRTYLLKSQSSDPNGEADLKKRAIKLVRKATKAYEESRNRKEPDAWPGRTERNRAWRQRMASLKDTYRQLRKDGRLS